MFVGAFFLKLMKFPCFFLQSCDSSLSNLATGKHVVVSWKHSWGGKGIWSWKKQVPNQDSRRVMVAVTSVRSILKMFIKIPSKWHHLPSCSANHLGKLTKNPQKIRSWIPFNWERASLSEFLGWQFFLSSKLVIAWITEVFTFFCLVTAYNLYSCYRI